MLGLHLVPDGIRCLDSLLHPEIEAGIFERLVYRRNEFVYALFLVGNVAVDLGADVIVCLRLLVAQLDVLHLGLYSVQAQAVGERNEDEHCLAKYLVPFVLRHVLDGAAVVEPVGELDEDYADIVIESK